MKQKRFKLEYKDSIDMRCIQVIYGKSEKKAIQNFQVELLTQDDYMTQLIDIQEVNEDTVFVDNKSPNWKLEDGTELDKDSQDALNDAMSTYTNSEGLTLEQAMERVSRNKLEAEKDILWEYISDKDVDEISKKLEEL